MAARRQRRTSGNSGTAGDCQIRRIAPDDLPALVALERASFSDAWSRAQLESSLERIESFGYVATESDVVVGYVHGRQVVDQAEILSLAVAPERRRRGVGASLLGHVIGALSSAGVHDVWLEVRVSNHGAQSLYRAAGFADSGRRVDYYRHPVEDALVLHRIIAQSGTTMR